MRNENTIREMIKILEKEKKEFEGPHYYSCSGQINALKWILGEDELAQGITVRPTRLQKEEEARDI